MFWGVGMGNLLNQADCVMDEVSSVWDTPINLAAWPQCI